MYILNHYLPPQNVYQLLHFNHCRCGVGVKLWSPCEIIEELTPFDFLVSGVAGVTGTLLLFSFIFVTQLHYKLMLVGLFPQWVSFHFIDTWTCMAHLSVLTTLPSATKGCVRFYPGTPCSQQFNVAFE